MNTGLRRPSGAIDTGKAQKALVQCTEKPEEQTRTALSLHSSYRAMQAPKSAAL